MRIALYYLIVGLLSFSELTLASSEILWVRLEKLFTYKDIEKLCSTVPVPGSFYLGMELEEGKAKAALLKTDTVEVLTKKLGFTAKELEGISVQTDNNGRTWIKSILLDARQLNWLFYEGGGLDNCVPSQALATLGPNDFRFEFNLADILANSQVTSNLGKFSGKKKDGGFYQISLSLTQNRISQ